MKKLTKREENLKKKLEYYVSRGAKTSPASFPKRDRFVKYPSSKKIWWAY